MRLIVMLLAGCTLLLSACGDNTQTTSTAKITYTLTDTTASGAFAPGRSITLIYAATTDCGSTSSTEFVQAVSGAITNTTGPVTVSFKLETDGPFLESAYIDVNASTNLDNGDLVLGTVASGALPGICYDSLAEIPLANTIDWTNTWVSEFGGSTPWAGGAQAF